MIDIIMNMIEALFKYVYIFRIGWAITVLMGVAMLITAVLIAKKGHTGKMPWILGGFGVTMAISSGTQLLFSIVW